IAAHSCSHGAGTDPATGQVIVNTDGSVQCVSGCTDIGPGQRTQMAMIVAEALGVPYTSVTITPYVDTDNTTDCGGTNCSRQTNTGGRGMYEAAVDARKQILAIAAEKFMADAKRRNEQLQVTPDELEIRGGSIFIKRDPGKKLTMEAAVGSSGLPVLGRSIYR